MKDIIETLLSLFIKKPLAKDIKNILTRENFIFTNDDVDDLLLGNEKGTRYGAKILNRIEGEQIIKRFVKIVLDGKWRTYQLFRRQIFVTEIVQNNIEKDGVVVKIIDTSLNMSSAYCIFETLPVGKRFGFMHDEFEYYERLSQLQIDTLTKQIFQFHSLGKNIAKSDFKKMQQISDDSQFYIKELKQNLNKKIIYKNSNGKMIRTTVSEVMGDKYGIKNFQDYSIKKMNALLNEAQRYIGNSYYLVHADMSIDNIYHSSNDEFILLDFEWVGIVQNPLVAIMYDYGNLRTRAWSSPSFQKKLDKSFLNVGVLFGLSTESIKLAMQLGLLRSTVLMSSYHLDYYHTTENDKRSDSEYYALSKAVLLQWKVLENLQ
jgi:hypothetical protein